ncbi:MAG: hypothetical protein P4K83_02060 [Terracidiphilus sp.]|nr:hypothetical protein [Terracidiphilus sp.]
MSQKINLNQDVPEPPANAAPVKWQSDESGGDATTRNVSAYIAAASVDVLGVVRPDGSTLSVDDTGTLTATGTLPALVLSAATTASTATAGGASALPAMPSGYLVIQIGSSQFKVPFYAM